MMDAMEVAAALRRAAENAGCGLHEVVSGGGDCPEGSCNGCREASAAWANEAADAIERCAMPEGVEWPVVGGRKVDFKTAYAPGLGALEAVSIYNNGACEVMSHDGIIKNVKDIHIARPKVLDADGAEIRVGDTVYGTDGQQYEVTGLSEHEPSIVHARTVGDGVAAVELLALSGQLNSAQLEASNLTHQRPVLDADGVPLREGETVYEVEGTGHACKVVGIRVGDGDPLTPTVVTCDVGDGTSEHFLPSQLTHTKPEPPDSWERIEEDARKNPFDYCTDVGHRLDTCLNAERVKSRDLVRRCRALAERGER